MGWAVHAVVSREQRAASRMICIRLGPHILPPELTDSEDHGRMQRRYPRTIQLYGTYDGSL